MRVFHGLAEVPDDFGASAITIGKFDGVHAGHRAVLGALREVARDTDVRSVVITFDRHPLALLDPPRAPASLVGLDQRLDLLAETGVDAVLVLAFDRALAGLAPTAFVDDVLVGALHATEVLVGSDFRFGHRNAGDVALLRELAPSRGFRVRIVDDVTPSDGRRVSSTWIRSLVDAGDLPSAAELLGHVPTVRGVVVHGAKRGRELGFPTANLSPESTGLVPPDGVYAGWLTDRGIRYPAAISVGDNPTFEGVPARQVEAHALDADLDLYDHVIDVAFVERIRGQVAYRGIEPLIAQMQDDVATTRRILGLAAEDAAPVHDAGSGDRP